MKILHVLNYGYPYIDGYTVRSSGLMTAQMRYLGYDVAAVTSPFPRFTKAQDRAFMTDAWNPDRQFPTPESFRTSRLALSSLERPNLGLAPTLNAEFRDHMRETVRRWQPDLIHAHHPHYVGSAARQVAVETNIPFVYEVRCFNGDYDLEKPTRYHRVRGHWFNYLEARLARQADTVVTISDGLAERIRGFGAKNVHVVRNSVDIGRFSAPPKPPPTDQVVIGYATTFMPMEGLDTLLRAIAQVDDPRLTARLAGRGPDWQRIHDLREELGLQKRVELPGFIPYSEMPNYYRSLDLFVVPRRPVKVARDTTPLKPLEALASGLPLLSTGLPALRELLGGREDVRFVEPTVDGLAGGLRAYLAAAWQGQGELRERSWETEIARYAAVYAGK